MTHKQLILLIALLYCSFVGATAQTVTNVQAKFTDCNIEVRYDLATTKPVNLTLQYSGDDGNTWIPCATVTGATNNQSAGTNKLIIWDNQADNIRHGLFDFRVELPPKEQAECVEINGVCWATCNVDAPGAFTDNPEDAGMFYQWNRKKGWPATGTVTGWDSSYPTGTTWETANNVCPAGYRVPTDTEIQSLIAAGSQWTTQNGVAGRVFGSGDNSLFLPAAGYRNSSDGSLYDAGSYGYYWSSTQNNSSYAYYLDFNSSDAGRSNSYRYYGFSVRCVAE